VHYNVHWGTAAVAYDSLPFNRCSDITFTKKSGRPRKRWIDEVEDDLKIMGIRNWHAVAKDHQEWRKIVLEAKVHNGL
jgi:hypothetical protein